MKSGVYHDDINASIVTVSVRKGTCLFHKSAALPVDHCVGPDFDWAGTRIKS